MLCPDLWLILFHRANSYSQSHLNWWGSNFRFRCLKAMFQWASPMKYKNPNSHTYFTIANGISGSPKMLLVSWKESDAMIMTLNTFSRALMAQCKEQELGISTDGLLFLLWNGHCMESLNLGILFCTEWELIYLLKQWKQWVFIAQNTAGIQMAIFLVTGIWRTWLKLNWLTLIWINMVMIPKVFYLKVTKIAKFLWLLFPSYSGLHDHFSYQATPI